MATEAITKITAEQFLAMELDPSLEHPQLVDPEAGDTGELTAFRRGAPGERFEDPVVFENEATVTSPLLPGFAEPLARLLRPS